MTNKNSKFAKVKNYLAVPSFAVLAIIFAEKTYAKESIENLNQEKENVISDVFSDDPFAEYNQIIKKYGNLIEQKKYAEFDKVINLSDRAKLKELYFQLTKEQRNETPLYFFDIKKSEKENVSQKQLDDFMNSKKYGLWIDGKKTNNQDLKKYKPEDFSHESVSKRYPNAISKKNPEPYQVNLMTNKYFQDYRNEKEKIFMGFKAKAFIKGKDTIPIKRNTDNRLEKKTVQDISTAVEGTAANITPAEFPGGANKLRNLIQTSFNSAVMTGNEGLVKSTITFVVGQNGMVRDIKISGENEKINNEIYRVTKLANDNVTWKPAIKDGEPVAYQYKIPIAMNFEIYKEAQ